MSKYLHSGAVQNRWIPALHIRLENLYWLKWSDRNKFLIICPKHPTHKPYAATCPSIQQKCTLKLTQPLYTPTAHFLYIPISNQYHFHHHQGQQPNGIPSIWLITVLPDICRRCPVCRTSGWIFRHSELRLFGDLTFNRISNSEQHTRTQYFRKSPFQFIQPAVAKDDLLVYGNWQYSLCTKHTYGRADSLIYSWLLIFWYISRCLMDSIHLDSMKNSIHPNSMREQITWMQTGWTFWTFRDQ